jgi:hypothetical protein
MSKHLWAWERCQFRNHRVTVARALADQVNQTAWPHMSPEDCRQTYISLLPHYNFAGKDSPLLDDADFPALEKHFSQLITETFPITEEYEDDAPVDFDYRPDSSVFTRGAKPTRSKCNFDMAAIQNVFNKMRNGHKRNAWGGSLPSSFLKQIQEAPEQDRPISMPAWWQGSMMAKLSA